MNGTTDTNAAAQPGCKRSWRRPAGRRKRYGSAAVAIVAVFTGVLALAGVARAADPALRLCTARKDGIYYFAGEQIAAAAKGHGVAVTVVETAGSLFNLASLGARVCDAAIVQADVVPRLGEVDRSGQVALVDPVLLHREFVHLVCRRDSGFSRLADIAGRGAKARVQVGEPGSGTAATWAAFSDFAPAYRRVTTEFVGRTVAVNRLTTGQADCLLYVAGLGADYMAAVAAAGSDLRLVAVDDETLSAAQVLGVAPYRLEDIPAGTYPGLQAEGEAVRTISVQAVAVANRRWADRHPAGQKAFLAAIDAARPAILERAGQAAGTE